MDSNCDVGPNFILIADLYLCTISVWSDSLSIVQVLDLHLRISAVVCVSAVGLEA